VRAALVGCSTEERRRVARACGSALGEGEAEAEAEGEDTVEGAIVVEFTKNNVADRAAAASMQYLAAANTCESESQLLVRVSVN
jgi:uncharacterized protein (DUF1330 family)